MNGYFYNKRVLVSGASSGIGFALSNALSEQGAQLVLIARNAEKLDAVKKTLTASASSSASNNPAELYALDICDQQAIAKTMPKIFSRPVDIVINNAGIASNNHFEQLDDDCFRSMIETNFLAQVSMCRYALEAMKKQRHGHIVNVASMAGVLGITGYTAYGASKFALVGFTRALRNELSGTGIKTTLVLPSDVATPQLEAEETTRTAANRAVVGTGANAMSAELAAKKMLVAIKKQQTEVVISNLSGRVLLRLCELFPSTSRLVLDSIAIKHQK